MDELAAKGIVVHDNQQYMYSFHHDVIRQAAYSLTEQEYESHNLSLNQNDF